MNKFISSLLSWPRHVAVWLINIYQALLSPDHSWLKSRWPYGYCRFYPSCSQYAKGSIARFGLIAGLILTIKRLLKCHPWAKPSVDPVPKHFSFK